MVTEYWITIGQKATLLERDGAWSCVCYCMKFPCVFCSSSEEKWFLCQNKFHILEILLLLLDYIFFLKMWFTSQGCPPHCHGHTQQHMVSNYCSYIQQHLVSHCCGHTQKYLVFKVCNEVQKIKFHFQRTRQFGWGWKVKAQRELPFFLANMAIHKAQIYVSRANLSLSRGCSVTGGCLFLVYNCHIGNII